VADHPWTIGRAFVNIAKLLFEQRADVVPMAVVTVVRRQVLSFWRSHRAGSKLSYDLVAPRTTCEWCPFAATLWLSVHWRLHAPIDHRQLASGENGQ
jgi:hypothetical protein